MPKTFSIAFYNLENLFDSEHDEFTLDKDFTPEGEYQWNERKYQIKIQNLAKVISKIGFDSHGISPVFLGVSEVENDTCLEDLINSEQLKPFNYNFVHYDSADERGIDVAFLYQEKSFELIYSDTFPLILIDENQDRDYTRDILLVHGKLLGEPLYIVVNHWPSRNKSRQFSNAKRVQAAKLINQIIKDIYKESANAKIIIMGDFNDDPNSSSIKNNLVVEGLFNPMLNLLTKNRGSVKYRNKWFLFDQIILTNNFLETNTGKLRFINADIFDPFFLKESKGKREGAPKRTFVGKWHLGGYSDHFPVFVNLVANR